MLPFGRNIRPILSRKCMWSLQWNPQLLRTIISPSKNDHSPLLHASSSSSSVPGTELAIPRILKPIAPSDSYISCTIFDETGKVKEISKKFPKTKFLTENGLFPRDLRKIDTSTVDVVPTIAVRPNCILVNLLYIKSIIKKDKTMIFDTSTVSSASKLGLFMYDLESKLTNKNSSHEFYEFRAIESILINVMSSLETELNHHVDKCGTILLDLENNVDRVKLRDLLINSKALTTFYQKALLIRNVLDELLDNDDDLLGMYLSDTNKTIENTDEIEMLLEAYYKQCDEFVQQAETLINDIKSTEEIVNIILDANRNSLMLFELKVTIYTLGFTVATTLPAFYGMNLKNYIEDSNFGFGGIFVLSVLGAMVITVLNFKRLRTVQRLTMMLPNGPESRLIPQHTSKPPRFGRLRGWLTRHKKPLYDKDPKQRDMIWRWLVDKGK